VNGVSQSLTTSGTATFSSSTATYQPNIGRYQSYTGNANYLLGYVSNLRLVNGTRVYTSNFTPSTTPLTAITNTTLLTCQSGSFSDASTNNYTISTIGSPYIVSQNPFGISYGGGGGGSCESGGNTAQGGMGGGGTGNPSATGNGATAGATNTGGGAGGNNGFTGGRSGGSGVVVISYPSSYAAAASTTGSPTVSAINSNRIYTFTGSGSITF